MDGGRKLKDEGQFINSIVDAIVTDNTTFPDSYTPSQRELNGICVHSKVRYWKGAET